MANKRGRPPLDRTDRSVVVSLRMPGQTFDAYCRRASAERLSVPEVLRRALRITANRETENPET